MIRHIVLSSTLILFGASALADPAGTYGDFCASCHGVDRLGGTGPALIPQTLRRMRGPNIEDVIQYCNHVIYTEY